MKLFLYAVLGLLLCVDSIAESKTNLLKKQLKATKPDTNRVKILCELSYINQNEIGLEYARQALNLAISIRWKKGIAASKLGMGMCAGEDNMKLNHLNEALRTYSLLGDGRGMARAELNLGKVFTDKSKYGDASEHLFKSLDISIEIKDTLGIQKAYANLSRMYEQNVDKHQALQYADSANRYAWYLNDTILIQRALANLGALWFGIGETDNAILHSNLALQIAVAQKDTGAIATNLLNLSSYYLKKKRFELSLASSYEALALSKIKELSDNEASCYHNIANVLYLQSNVSGIAAADKKKLLRNALTFCGNAIAINTRDKALFYLYDNFLLLSQIQGSLGNFKKAYYAHILYSTLKDSIFTQEKTLLIEKNKGEHNLEVERLKLKAEDDRKREEQLSQRIIDVAVIAALILSISYLYIVVVRKDPFPFIVVLTRKSIVLIVFEIVILFVIKPGIHYFGGERFLTNLFLFVVANAVLIPLHEGANELLKHKFEAKFWARNKVIEEGTKVGNEPLYDQDGLNLSEMGDV